jgi:hypothetical protein
MYRGVDYIKLYQALADSWPIPMVQYKPITEAGPELGVSALSSVL